MVQLVRRLSIGNAFTSKSAPSEEYHEVRIWKPVNFDRSGLSDITVETFHNLQQDSCHLGACSTDQMSLAFDTDKKRV